MNVHESEKIRGILYSLGMNEIDDIEKANVVVFNTCCIREGAEDRAYSNISALKKWKQQNPDNVIIVCGCMPQQKNGKYNFKTKLPFVDIVVIVPLRSNSSYAFFTVLGFIPSDVASSLIDSICCLGLYMPSTTYLSISNTICSYIGVLL